MLSGKCQGILNGLKCGNPAVVPSVSFSFSKDVLQFSFDFKPKSEISKITQHSQQYPKMPIPGERILGNRILDGILIGTSLPDQ